MSLEEREGTLDLVSDRGILLSGDRLSYSKWFEGERPTQDSVGCKVRVLLDVGTKCSFLKRVLAIGEKSIGWKPPESEKKGFFGGGGGRRLSPEELELKREEGTRIARSVAIDRAITMVERGVSIEKLAPIAGAVEEYILRGTLPKEAAEPRAEALARSVPEQLPTASPPMTPPSAGPENPPPNAPANESTPSRPAKPKRLSARAVNALFNEALRGGLVDDWHDFMAKVEEILKVRVKSPYHIDLAQWSRVEAFVRTKLGTSSAA
jgi:hypothetical protein